MGNSGAEIAKELIRDRNVYISGEPSAVQPFRPEGLSGRLLMPFVGRVILNGVLTTSTPMGRKARSKMLHQSSPAVAREAEGSGFRRSRASWQDSGHR